MRKIIVCTSIIFSYNVLLLILPIMLFLMFVKWSNPSSLHFLPWIYCPFLLISPILSIVMGYTMIKDRLNLMNALIPIASTLIGYLPLFVFYRFINSLWMPADYFFLLGIPLLLGLIVDTMVISMPVLIRWWSQMSPP